MMKKLYAILMMILPATMAMGQVDLMDLLEQNTGEQTDYVSATFKSTRVLNGHSIERMPGGQLDFRISHRFGRVNSGPYELFGLDQANIHFSLEYGIFDWMMVGVGRGTYEKTYDGFLKFSPLRQSTGARSMPVSLSLLTSAAMTSLKWPDPEQVNYFSSRLSYVSQVIVARKFSQSFSAQLAPTFIHRNLVATELDPNDLYAIGAGGRIKLSKRISFNAEYYYLVRPVNDYASQKVYDPLSLGFDIETGGHVFQIILTNSLSMIEKGFIGETTGNWFNGDIHIGFNISRVFTLKK